MAQKNQAHHRGGNSKPAIAESEKQQVESLIQAVRETLDASAVEPVRLQKIRDGYLHLTAQDKGDFFSRLLNTVEVQPDDINPLLEQLSSAINDPSRWQQALIDLRSGIESPRLRLFRHFISLPGGLKFLLDLRADILSALRRGMPELSPLDRDLVYLFEAWFQGGFLFLEEISLDSSFRQIEIIKNGDMVHPMTSLEEMGQRLGRDRRCFALYHQAMPEEPVVFIEVALTKGIVKSIQEIIGPRIESKKEQAQKDTAVFYSINNTQNGLAGLGLGQFLIFQVVDYLKKDAPEIKTFCTLSPMTGFWPRYLRPMLEGASEGLNMKIDDMMKVFDKQVRALLKQECISQGGSEESDFAKTLLQVFSNPKWMENKTLLRTLSKPLERLGYAYLTEESDRAGRYLDPVANFHLGNGATLSPRNVNFGATWTPQGLEGSLSLMVNYMYSQNWWRQIRDSMAKLGGRLPGLSRPWGR
ncbi:MAG: malonyl-CoA decarboxylase family protein [Deltaproteobacteria bacterium]|nr:malonyl-CoA decarboxylase family protein [Deltaproteobacteria bacterium]MBW2087007.1 malonyl-CoA decarboxylase family protein [Deltaproteobacteria bacterium]